MHSNAIKENADITADLKNEKFDHPSFNYKIKKSTKRPPKKSYFSRNKERQQTVINDDSSTSQQQGLKTNSSEVKFPQMLANVETHRQGYASQSSLNTHPRKSLPINKSQSKFVQLQLVEPPFGISPHLKQPVKQTHLQETLQNSTAQVDGHMLAV